MSLAVSGVENLLLAWLLEFLGRSPLFLELAVGMSLLVELVAGIS